MGTPGNIRTIVPSATLFDLLKEQFPKAVEVWDREDYQIHAPLSLDDPPEIHVKLINKGKRLAMVCRFTVERKPNQE